MSLEVYHWDLIFGSSWLLGVLKAIKESQAEAEKPKETETKPQAETEEKPKDQKEATATVDVISYIDLTL